MNPKTLITILLLIFSGVLFFLLVMPKVREVRELASTKTRLQGEVETVREKIVSTKNTIAKFTAIEQGDITRIEAALPKEIDLPNLLVLVESLISSSGLITQDIDVLASKPIVRRAAAQTTSQSAGGISPRFLSAPTEEDRGHAVATIAFSMLGTYESFKAFLQDAERSLRIFDVETISFSSPASGQSAVFSFSMKMKTYYKE